MQTIHTKKITGESPAGLTYDETLSDYLGDESKLAPSQVQEIFVPSSEEDLSLYVSHFSKKNDPSIFIGGGATGVAGGKVPSERSGATTLISTKKIKDIQTPVACSSSTHSALITVGAGATLLELEEYLRESYPQYSFPVDPTEKWASVGGMLSTNASGARGYAYGSVRNWIESASFVLSDGRILKLTRGKEKLENGQCQIDEQAFTFEEIPKPLTKNAVGFFCSENCDLLDVFIGSEGCLGICTEVTLRLIETPLSVFSYVQFFNSAEDALTFVVALRRSSISNCISIEFLDKAANEYALRGDFKAKPQIAQLREEGFDNSVIAEFFLSSEDELESIMDELVSLVSSLDFDMEKGICGTEQSEIDELKKYRHAVPENINAEISRIKKSFPECRKVGTDMSVPDDKLEAIFNIYKKEFGALEHVVMGHAGDNHFHVNILPRNECELSLALESYAKIAEMVVQMGGAVSAEHGIGRIKKNFLTIQYDTKILDRMLHIKQQFDPNNILNPGVLLDAGK